MGKDQLVWHTPVLERIVAVLRVHGRLNQN
jgi:hypothetical protein